MLLRVVQADGKRKLRCQGAETSLQLGGGAPPSVVNHPCDNIPLTKESPFPFTHYNANKHGQVRPKTKPKSAVVLSSLMDAVHPVLMKQLFPVATSQLAHPITVKNTMCASRQLLLYFAKSIPHALLRTESPRPRLSTI